MTPERWQQIEKIYHSALELAESERPAFLEKACAGDEALRQEVESLLRSEQSGDRFIEEPALEVAAKMMAHEKPEYYSDNSSALTRSSLCWGPAAWESSTRRAIRG